MPPYHDVAPGGNGHGATQGHHSHTTMKTQPQCHHSPATVRTCPQCHQAMPQPCHHEDTAPVPPSATSMPPPVSQPPTCSVDVEVGGLVGHVAHRLQAGAARCHLAGVTQRHAHVDAEGALVDVLPREQHRHLRDTTRTPVSHLGDTPRTQRHSLGTSVEYPKDPVPESGDTLRTQCHTL